MPQVKFPFLYLTAGGGPAPGDMIQLSSPSKARDYVVVSQCCDLEKRTTVSVAPVKSTAPIRSPEERATLRATEPSEGVGFAYSQLALEPLGETLPALGGDRLSFAALDDIESVINARDAFAARVVARMTPAGRRLLRIKLSLFFGRAEAEDAAILVDQGIQEGL